MQAAEKWPNLLFIKNTALCKDCLLYTSQVLKRFPKEDSLASYLLKILNGSDEMVPVAEK